MSIGPAEIIIVLILALLVFGPKRLPQMGRSLGRGVREFRKAADTAKEELGLGEVTDQINEVKETFTSPLKEATGAFSEPLDEVKGTFNDLKSSVDIKSAVEAPVATAGAAEATSVAADAAPATVEPPRSPAPPDAPAAVAADESPAPSEVPVAVAAEGEQGA